KSTIRPEFLNRIDEIIMFEPLKQNEIAQVVRIQLNGIVKMLKSNGVNLEFTDSAVDLIAELGFDPEFGARPVKRVIQRQVLDTLSKKLLAGTVDRSVPIVIDTKDGELEFKN
ncbi:type VI secretion system ATPase TssH, partial [Dysgonomonas sp. OttesenSCG-928-M03]|nr:type VI secretion system ATPase TssH [Dysgonomonas sp. OttesenSCG-928-M03]